MRISFFAFLQHCPLTPCFSVDYETRRTSTRISLFNESRVATSPCSFTQPSEIKLQGGVQSICEMVEGVVVSKNSKVNPQCEKMKYTC